MIKTTVKRPPRKGKPYPKLMKSRVSGVIVLFESEGRGMVVYSHETASPVGHFSSEWGDTFEDFEGAITLENE